MSTDVATLGEIRENTRGLSFIRWTDHYDKRCSLQKSGHQEEPTIWLGCSNNQFDAAGRPLSPRMHLARPQVEALVNHLVAWLETGELDVNGVNDEE